MEYCKHGHEWTQENTGRNKHGFRYCKTCNRLNARNGYWKNPERAKTWHKENYARRKDAIKEVKRKYRAANRHREAKYNLAISFNEMLTQQGNVCKACKLPADSYNVDHDHSCCPGAKSCGKCVRGLLCRDCNMALGFALDSPDRLIALAEYLQSYGRGLM